MKKALSATLTIFLCVVLLGCAAQSDLQEEPKAPATSQKGGSVDKSALQRELDSQGQYEKDNFPEEYWDIYVIALDNAHAALADQNVTQDEVDSAESSLRNSEYSLVNATSRDHPKKFDYDWYTSGSFHARDGAWVVTACMVSLTFEDGGKRYLIATIANDDATLSDVDVLLQPTNEASLDTCTEGSVLAILGTTEEIKVVTAGDKYSNAYLPVINVVRVEEAPQ